MVSSIDELIEMHSQAIEHYARAGDPKTAFTSAGVDVIAKAQNIFRVELESLDANEVRQIGSFYRSPAG